VFAAHFLAGRVPGEETVSLWLHDTGEFYAESDSLPEFVDWLIDYFWQFKDEEEQGQTDQVAARIRQEMALATDHSHE
jgi:hypothetical protein